MIVHHLFVPVWAGRYDGPYFFPLSFPDWTEMEFPSSLSSTERAFIHRMAQSLGYISKSKG